MAWITRDTIFGLPIDDVFSYKTPKVVRIQDRALGITSLVLKFLAFLFVSANLLLGHKGYLKYEPVTGTIGGQLLGTVQGLNKSTLPYCQNGASCRLMDMFSIVAPNPSPASIFISTFMREHRQERVCDEDQDVCELHSPFQTVATREYFVAGVEKYDLLVSHEAQAFQTFTRTRDQRYIGNVSTMTGRLRQFTDDGTGRVRYVVQKKYDAGENVMMSLDEFLSMAGLTLDSVLPGHYKPIRQTGVHLDCYLTYSNTHAWLSPTPQLDWTMEIFPGNQNVRRFEAPVGFGKERMLIERVGIRVTFKQDGLLGHFSWLALLRTLTIGFMLFTLIGLLLDAICTRFMPLAYKYEDAKYEFTENIYNLREALNMTNDQMFVGGKAVSGMMPLSENGSARDNWTTRSSEMAPNSSRTPPTSGRARYGALSTGAAPEGQRPPPMYPEGSSGI